MQFVCRYGTQDGRVERIVQSGSDAAAVRNDLERRGFHVFEVRTRGFPLVLKNPFSRRRRRMPMQEFLAFNLELAALLRAGLPLLQSLDLMLERQEVPALKEVLTEVRDRVESGEELSSAFASFGDLFPPLYAATLKAGERSGELESVIRRFIRYLRLILDARKRVVSALVYPVVLIGLSVIMLVVMAVLVVPKFSRFYQDLDAELPALTQVTLGISFWLRDHIVMVGAGLAISFLALRTWSKTQNGRLTIDKWRLRVPLLGEVFRFFALSEFCRSLGTLIAGGIPLVTAIQTAIGSVSNRFISGRLEPVLDDVRQGEAFYRSIEKTKVFPGMSIDMVKVGEATGSLDEMLNNVSDYFDEHVETRIQRLLTMFEPMMLVVMGTLIAILLISIYLPMFGALSQVGN